MGFIPERLSMMMNVCSVGHHQTVFIKESHALHSPTTGRLRSRMDPEAENMQVGAYKGATVLA